MKRFVVPLTVLSTLGLMGNSSCESTDQKQARQTEQMVAEGHQQVQMPGIRYWRERRMMKMLYEMRDSELATYSYVWSYDGSLVFLCNSIGYGLPYAAQFTNPQRVVGGGSAMTTLPQAEPNGLYMPSSAEASWVMCVDPADKKGKPVYVEPRVLVSPFPLQSRASYLEKK